MSENMKNLNEENLESVAGGNDGMYCVYGTVHDVVAYDSTACLTFRDAPNGNVMFDNSGTAYGWQNGQQILVYPDSRQGSWIKARMGDMIGWVNANYVWY